MFVTCAEVDDEVEEEESIGDAVEDDPSGAEVVIEERYGNRKNDEIGDQNDEHEKIPIKSNKNNIEFEFKLLKWGVSPRISKCSFAIFYQIVFWALPRMCIQISTQSRVK